MIALLITIVLFPLVGFAAARVLRVPVPHPIAARIAFLFLLGVGMHGALLFAGLPYYVPPLLALISLGVRRLRLRFSTSEYESGGIASALLNVVFAIPLIVLLFAASILPTRDYDGRVTWLPKARAIALEQSTTGPFFHGERGLNLHNRYPLLLPLDAATVMTISNDTRNEAARWLYVLIPIAMLVVLRAMLTEPWVAAALAWLGVLAAIEGGALAAYNDFALAAFFGIALLYLAGQSPSAFGAGLFAAFAVMSKNEGAVLALAIVIAAMFVFRSMKDWVWLLAPIAIAEAIVIRWRMLVPAAYDEQYEVLVRSLPASFDRVPAAVLAVLRHAIDWNEWGGFWIAVAIAIVVSVIRDRSKRLAIPLVAMAVALAAYVAALSVTSWRVEDLAPVAVNRLLVHLLVPAAFLVTLALRKTERAAGVTPTS